ncbi:MAG: hypothetical protein DCC43_12585 [Candidatus Brocadia sp.]|nr:hypothetical protein [Candidatus Brocadia fulgida]MCE7912177.1 hypothetical protein [Candidatus Brocadia sp. AMX3]OQY98924.1 MAG: hypothetical protein B6D35_10760 [Candidatus Brocadia sp. UTAMX2]RIJ94052.1 MAG: hypothetical protein DCC43_12585 [Candidatus Brocadia sp.]
MFCNIKKSPFLFFSFKKNRGHSWLDAIGVSLLPISVDPNPNESEKKYGRGRFETCPYHVPLPEAHLKGCPTQHEKTFLLKMSKYFL